MAAILTLGILGAVLGLGLAIAAEVLRVEPDKRVQEIENLLPGANCGACGYPGCSAFAEAIVEGEVKNLSLCKPANEKTYKEIIQYLREHPDKDGNVIKVEK